MTLPTQYSYIVKHPPGHVLSITVNDIPFYRRHSDCHVAPSGPFNHWMVEGVNELSLVINQSEPQPGRSFKIAFEIVKVTDGAHLLELLFPDLLLDHPVVEQDLPIHHKMTFRLDEPSPRPVWMDSPRTNFPIEGTREQHAALIELHEAQAQGDAGEFLRVCDVKAREMIRFYGPQETTDPATAKGYLARIMAEPWDLAPLDLHELTFERRGDGRTAYVSRRDGRSALFAQHRTDPDRTWEVNPHLTMIDGKWRIFA